MWPYSICSGPPQLKKYCHNCHAPRCSLTTEYTLLQVLSILCSERQMGRRGDRRPKEVMNPGCPSGKRNPRNRLWQAGRDNGTDHNGTSSRLPKDLGRVPAACACSGKSGGVCGAMMRRRYPQPVTAPPCSCQGLPGAWQIRQLIEIRYNGPGL